MERPYTGFQEEFHCISSGTVVKVKSVKFQQFVAKKVWAKY